MVFIICCAIACLEHVGSTFFFRISLSMPSRHGWVHLANLTILDDIGELADLG